MTIFAAYSSLFLVAFLAATIFPAQSEALLVGMLIKTDFWPWGLIAIASIGNILGSCVNWWLGTSLEKFKNRKWFPASEQALIRAQGRYHRYGKWSLLLSWVPFIGDPITVIAGFMKERFLVFLLYVSVAKTARYLVLAFLTLQSAKALVN